MTGADSDSQAVAAGAFNEFYSLIGIGVGSILGVNLNSVFNACQSAKLCLNYNASFVCIFNNTTSHFDIFFKRMLATVNHNGGEAAVDAGFADVKIFAVVQMQADRQTGVFNCCFNQLHQVDVVSVFAGAGTYLQNQRGFFLLCCGNDTLDDFHVVDVEGTNSIVAFVSFLNISVDVTKGICLFLLIQGSLTATLSLH